MRHVQILNRWGRTIEDFYITFEPSLPLLKDAIRSWSFTEDDLPLTIHYADRKWRVDEILNYEG